MKYKHKFFYLCKTPLSAEGPEDVEIIDRAEHNDEFPELFKEYEELRSHAFNEDKLYSIIRADDIYLLLRTGTEKEAREKAFEESRQEIITNLQHRVMQKGDDDAKAILKEVHDVEA
jgi:predicted RNA-binding protein (virulence factor B family)